VKVVGMMRVMCLVVAPGHVAPGPVCHPINARSMIPSMSPPFGSGDPGVTTPGSHGHRPPNCSFSSSV